MNKKTELMKRNDFEKTVKLVPHIARGYRSNLSALGKNKKKVNPSNFKLLCGSVDIDSCTKALYPNESRWDYVLCYDKKVLFLEVHEGTTHGFTEVLSKRDWLVKWLKSQAVELDKLVDHKSNPFYWVVPGKILISKRSTQFRKANLMNLLPRKQLMLH